MRHYFRLALVAPLRSPLLSALPFIARLPMGKHCLVPFLGGKVHARTSSSTPPTYPTVDAEVRAQEAKLSKAEVHKVDIESAKAEATADIDLGAAKARAEMDAAKAKIEFEEAVVKASASKAKAEAYAAKAKAEAEVAKAKARAGAAMAKVNLDSAMQKIEAEAQSQKYMVFGSQNFYYAALFVRLVAALLTSIAVWLGYDHATHSFGPLVRWNMKRRLKEGPAEQELPAPPVHSFPAALPNFDARLPIIVLGPTGSGKSTLLGRLARDFKSRGVPVAYVRLRGLSEDKGGRGAGEGGGGEDIDGKASALKTLTTATTAVFSAIGYPSRPSHLSRLSLTRMSVESGSVGADIEVQEAREALRHFHCAVTDLFIVCKELYGERGEHPWEERAPVIIMDELHELVRSEQVKRQGGLVAFQHLAAEFTRLCTDGGAARFCAAASTFALQDELNLTVARDFRVRIFTTQDPPQQAVLDHLRGKGGYTPSLAQQIMDTCGTRPRLLGGFLAEGSGKGADPASLAAQLRALVVSAEVAIDNLFTHVEGDLQSQKALVSVMDRMCAGEKGVPIQALPKHLRKLPGTCSAVIYWAAGNTIEIHSLPYRKAWSQKRRQYAQAGRAWGRGGG